MIWRMRALSSGVTSDALLSRTMLQNSICCRIRFSISSSSRFSRMRLSPQANSSCSLRASTTVTMQSRRGKIPLTSSLGSILGMVQMVLAIGSGSQIPLASMTM